VHVRKIAFTILATYLVVSIPLRAQALKGQSGNATLPDMSLVRDSVMAPLHNAPPLRWYSMFTNIPNDWVRYTSRTFTMENLPAIVAMTAVTAALVVTDDITWRSSRDLYKSSSVIHSGSDIFEWVGDGRPQFGLAAGFAAYGFLADDSRALRTASQTTEVILACGVVVQLLKHLTGRESPIVATQPGGAWRLFPNQIEYHKHVPNYDAYPSGHVATALATVIVIGENYPEATWIKPVGYTLVTLLAVSMVNTGIHWYSDYPLGIALGYSFGMLVSHPESFQVGAGSESDEPSLTFAPRIDPRGNGLQLTLRF